MTTPLTAVAWKITNPSQKVNQMNQEVAQSPKETWGSVALVTCTEALGFDYDMQLLLEAVTAQGLLVREVSWDDETIDWSSFDLVVIRSTWDYHRRYEQFMKWVSDVSSVTTLRNAQEVIRWNTDKHYLSEIEKSGLPVVPTAFANSTTDDWLAELERLILLGDVVVKPTISAGSNDTERHSSIESASVHISSLLNAGRAVMLQPYLIGIESEDETGLVFLDGIYSHAFAKGALLAAEKNMSGGLYAEERIASREATSEQLLIGERTINWLTQRFGKLLYARVDLVPGSAGPTIMEIELTEPSLYLALHPAAAEQLAKNISREMSTDHRL